MNFISFRRLKLFKGPSSRQKSDEEGAPAAKEKAGFFRRLFQSPFPYLVIFVAVLSYILSYVPPGSLPKLEEGQIAPADLVSPLDLTIEDTETTAKRRVEAEEAVLPVYTLDENSFLGTEDRIRLFFQFGREWLKTAPSPVRIDNLQKAVSEKLDLEVPAADLDALVKSDFSTEIQETLVSLVAKVSAQGIIVSKDLFIRKEEERGMILMRAPGNERQIKVDEVLDLQQARELFAADVEKLEVSSRVQRLLVGLADVFLRPNVNFNRLETEARKERARSRVETAFFRIKKGKVILRKGDEATAEDLKWISMINANLRETRGWMIHLAGTFLLFALFFVTVWYYLKSLLKFRAAFDIFLMTGVTLILGLLVYKLASFLASVFTQLPRVPVLTDVEVYRFAFPYQFGALVFAFLTSNTVTLIFAILNSLLVGYMFQGNFPFMLFSFIGGLAAIYGIRIYQKSRRTSVLRAGLFVVAPVNIFLIITLALIQEKFGGLGLVSVEAVMGLFGGAMSAALAFVLLPIFENLFGFVTQTKLLELTNSELPVFRQMAMEAPGSYHHSLVVATLAEKAAEEIGLDAMLVKAGALYHDIGKVKRPEYFIENISRNPDLHKDMTPSLSSLVIISHVKEGSETAKKLKLPKKIREIIEQHHGSSLVRYFYHKAKEVYDPEMQKIEEENYRYPGPAPQSKESALIMLADSVEAASRSLKSPSRESMKRLIIEIFENYLQDGQLDNSDFSLRELRAIAASFHATLYAIYHPRIQYPGFDFEIKKKKKPANEKRNHDRGPEPPA
jgi:putative nucleotidyltransferase with HDIG domain